MFNLSFFKSFDNIISSFNLKYNNEINPYNKYLKSVEVCLIVDIAVKPVFLDSLYVTILLNFWSSTYFSKILLVFCFK